MKTLFASLILMMSLSARAYSSYPLFVSIVCDQKVSENAQNYGEGHFQIPANDVSVKAGKMTFTALRSTEAVTVDISTANCSFKPVVDYSGGLGY